MHRIQNLGLILLAAALAGGCSGKRTFNGDPQSPPPSTAPPGAKPLAKDSKFLDATVKHPDIRPAPVASAGTPGREAPAAKPASGEGERYVGTLEVAPVAKGKEAKPDPTAPAPLTPDLAERLGGYRLSISGGRCTFSATGVDVEGPCREDKSGVILMPKTIAGKPKEEAEKDPAFATLTGSIAFVRDGDSLVVSLGGRDRVRFRRAGAAARP